MAITTPTLISPSGFDSLPLEIQREVLLGYFEDPCTITFHARKGPPFLVALDYRIGKEAQIALVSKHLHRETLLALKSSSHTILAFDAGVSGWHLQNIDRDPTAVDFAKHASTIQTEQFFYDIGFAPYQRLAPNLRAITLPANGKHPFPATPDLIQAADETDLLSVIQGAVDADIEGTVREYLIRLLDYWTPGWQFKGVTLTFSFCFAIQDHWMEDAPVGTELREYHLILTFENTEQWTRIVSKHFQRFDLKERSNDCAPQVEATEETMNRLTELSQQDLEKAAVELWYLGYLPCC